MSQKVELESVPLASNESLLSDTVSYDNNSRDGHRQRNRVGNFQHNTRRLNHQQAPKNNYRHDNLNNGNPSTSHNSNFPRMNNRHNHEFANRNNQLPPRFRTKNGNDNQGHFNDSQLSRGSNTVKQSNGQSSIQNQSENHFDKTNPEAERKRNPKQNKPKLQNVGFNQTYTSSKNVEECRSRKNELNIIDTEQNYNGRQRFQKFYQNNTGQFKYSSNQQEPTKHQNESFRHRMATGYQNSNDAHHTSRSYSKTGNEPKKLPHREKVTANPESQREIMDELLRKASYECMICCDSIGITGKTWSCTNCFNVFHLTCVQQWARKSNTTETALAMPASGSLIQDNSLPTTSSLISSQRTNNNSKKRSCDEWRCPTCQHLQKKFPHNYYCFCGKRKDPEPNRYYCPHSCGDTCSRQLKHFDVDEKENNAKDPSSMVCPHKCTLQCHPGKCPSCTAKIKRTCACTKTSLIMNCSSKTDDIQCSFPCNKVLDCGNHICTENCHFGSCEPCKQVFEVHCLCGKENKENVPCSKRFDHFSCDQICAKLLSCSFHTCTEPCHSGPCKPCAFDPETMKYCCCGKTLLTDLSSAKPRTLCIDPIPNCSKICNKLLTCGTEVEPHYCTKMCHSGPCPPCSRQTVLRCGCKANSQKFECVDLPEGNKFQCRKRCNKKLPCGRHKCLNECCVLSVHSCTIVCGKWFDFFCSACVLTISLFRT